MKHRYQINRLLRATLFLVLWSLLVPAIAAQPLVRPTPRVYEVFQSTPEYEEAMELAHMAGPERRQGVSALLALADRNPQTTLGAQCLFSALAYSESRSTMIALYQRIIREYPNSSFEIQARQSLMGMQLHSTEAWFNASAAMLRSYGAPTVSEIHQNPSRAVAKLRSIPLEYQHGLISHYISLEQLLGSSEVQRRREAISVCYFGREAFFYDTGAANSFENGIFWNIGLLNPVPKGKIEYCVRPELVIRSPHGPTSPRPFIRFESSLRGARSGSVNVLASKFMLDGQDVTDQVRVINIKVNPTAKKNQLFEQLLFEYRPQTNLPPGRHLFSGLLGNSQHLDDPALVKFEIPFTVRPGGRDCDDDKGPEDWNDRD